MLDKKSGQSHDNLSWLFFLAVALLCLYAWLAHLEASQVISLVKAVAWPLVALFVATFFYSHIAQLLGRVTGGKLPGGIEFQTTQAALETETGQEHEATDETQEFEKLTEEFVPNTKAALLWFSNQQHPVSSQVFIEAFGLPNPLPPETDIAAQKFVILGVLYLANLLEVQNNAYVITEKGRRFLGFINYI